MIMAVRLEHRVRVEPLRGDLNEAQHEHVRGGESSAAVEKEPDELEGAGNEAPRALGERLQVSLRVRPEEEEADEQPAHEEERVDAERAVGDGLEEKLPLDDLAVLHVVGELVGVDASVAQDHPRHRYRPETVDGADGVPADLAVADDLHVRADGEG